MPAELELRLQETGLRTGPDLGQPAPLRLGEGRLGPVGIGLAPPQLDGQAELFSRLLGATGGELRTAAGGEVPHADRVDGATVDGECIARAAAHHVPPR